MALGHSNREPLTSRTSPVVSGHIGGSPFFVDEHEVLWRQIELCLEPVPSAPQNVGTILLSGAGCLSLRIMS